MPNWKFPGRRRQPATPPTSDPGQFWRLGFIEASLSVHIFRDLVPIWIRNGKIIMSDELFQQY